MFNIRFSIATPTRNSLDKLKRCVGSVRGQRDATYEHLVQDAQSTDGTPEWLSAQADLLSVSVSDDGMYDAINRAWERSSGEFLSWLNSDEQYLPNTLATVQEFFDRNPEVDVLYGDYIVVDFKGRAIALRREIPFRRTYAVNSFINTASCTLFFRRRIFDEKLLEFDSSYRYAADMDLVLRLVAAGKIIKHIPQYISVFGIDGSNLSTHPEMEEEIESIRLKNGAFQSKVLRRCVLFGRYFERLLYGGYQKKNISYYFALDESPKYIEYRKNGIGGRYSLLILEGGVDTSRVITPTNVSNLMPLSGKLVAFFHQSSDLYGSDKIMLELAHAVQIAGGSAVVLIPTYGPLTEELAARNIEYHIVPILKLSRGAMTLRGMIALAKEVLLVLSTYNQIFLNRRVDLIHSNTLAVLGGALLAHRRKIQHLWHVHEIIVHPWLAVRVFPTLLRYMSDHIVCNSNATRHWLLDFQPGMSSKMCVISNGVERPLRLNQSEVADLRRSFLPSNARIAIGLVGRINRLKGHQLLMDAADQLHRRGINDFSVVFIGSPPPGQDVFLNELFQRIERSPMRELVVVNDFTRDVWPVYAALDIVCVPSTEPESFGLVAVEAMTAAKPVVASDLGALSEVVVDRHTGLLFEPNDAESLAICLEQLIRNSKLRLQLGNAGVLWTQKNFTVQKMRDSFVEKYASLIKF